MSDEDMTNNDKPTHAGWWWCWWLDTEAAAMTWTPVRVRSDNDDGPFFFVDPRGNPRPVDGHMWGGEVKREAAGESTSSARLSFRESHGRAADLVGMITIFPPVGVVIFAALVCVAAAALPGLLLTMLAAIPHWMRGRA